MFRRADARQAEGQGKARRCPTVAGIDPGKTAKVKFKVITKQGKAGKTARFVVDAA